MAMAAVLLPTMKSTKPFFENNLGLNDTDAFSTRRSTAPPDANKLPNHNTHCHARAKLLRQNLGQSQALIRRNESLVY